MSARKLQGEPQGERPGAGREGDAMPSAGRAVICPFCHSSDTEPLALFGSQLSTQQHYCRACHTPFEHLNRETHQRDPERRPPLSST